MTIDHVMGVARWCPEVPRTLQSEYNEEVCSDFLAENTSLANGLQ